jgi:hypothetical protein
MMFAVFLQLPCARSQADRFGTIVHPSFYMLPEVLKDLNRGFGKIWNFQNIKAHKLIFKFIHVRKLFVILS